MFGSLHPEALGETTVRPVRQDGSCHVTCWDHLTKMWVRAEAAVQAAGSRCDKPQPWSFTVDTDVLFYCESVNTGILETVTFDL